MLRPLVVVSLAATVGLPALSQAQAQDDFHWSGTVAAGKTVRISNISGNIKVSPSTSGKVEVVGLKHGDPDDFDRVRADVQETASGLSICVIYDDRRARCDDDDDWDRRRRGRMDAEISLEVTLPANVRLSAGNVSGDVTVSGTYSEVRASSVSGDVWLERLHVGAVNANSVSGDVRVQVDEFTSQGDLTFHSVSGDVILEAPKNFQADLSVSTVSGEIDSDFPLVLTAGRMGRRHIDARIGNGGRRFDVQTVSGDVSIRSIR